MKKRSTEMIYSPQSSARYLCAFISFPPLSNCFNCIPESLLWTSRFQSNLHRHFNCIKNTTDIPIFVFSIVQRKQLRSTPLQLPPVTSDHLFLPVKKSPEQKVSFGTNSALEGTDDSCKSICSSCTSVFTYSCSISLIKF